ncbi:MAG: hypothetical protein AB8C95_01900, partial [Phycisphaeraceae bacterium]
MTRPDHEIDAYLEGTLTAEQARVIDTWIAADPANAAAFLQLVLTHQTLQSLGKAEHLSQVADLPKSDALDHALLESMIEMEATAEPQAYADVAPLLKFEDASKRSEVDLAQAFADLRWAAGKAIYKLVRTPAFATVAIAAGLALAITLFLVFQGPSEPINTPAPNIAATPDQSDAVDTSVASVATLTATYNATWAPTGRASSPSHTLSPGSKLHAGDRLTLSAG